MAVNLTELPPLHPIVGLKVGTANAQIKPTPRDDLALFSRYQAQLGSEQMTNFATIRSPEIPDENFFSLPSSAW